MTNYELITGYRDIVFDIHGQQQRLAWNRRHGLPELDIPDKIQQLIQELIRFEDLIITITDLQARNIICLRYVLGLTVRTTAERMGMSCATVNRICTETMRNIA